MSAGIWFWLIYIFCFLFAGWYAWGYGPVPLGGSLVVFVLIGLLGWRLFGPPVT